MTGLTQILGPASETYAGYAWDYLRRNSEYARDYDVDMSSRDPSEITNNSQLRYEAVTDNLAHRWGLELSLIHI